MGFSNLFTIPARSAYKFMKTRSAADLWKSVTSVSNAGKKRGRRPFRSAVDLNRGQRFAHGLKYDAHFPGLHSVPYAELKKQDKDATATHSANTAATVPALRPRPQQRIDDLVELRTAQARRKGVKRGGAKVTPLERGWSGRRLPGQKQGPPDPDPLTGHSFEGFQSVCLEHKMVATGTSKGHRRRFSSMVAVGNGQGLIGVSVAKSLLGNSAVKSAKLKAAKRLEFIERLNGATIYQDFFAECGGCKIFAQRASEGSGLIAHRAIRDLCMLIGIKDLKVHIDGSTNVQSMTKAFLTGLRHQETFQQLSERKGLHVLEFSKENGYMPRVVASPALREARTAVAEDETLDVDELYGGGRIPQEVETPRPFFWGMTSFIHARWLQWPYRNHHKLKVRLLADGEVPSWNTRRRREWAEAKHAAVLSGEAIMPQGIGIHKCTRQQLQDED